MVLTECNELRAEVALLRTNFQVVSALRGKVRNLKEKTAETEKTLQCLKNVTVSWIIICELEPNRLLLKCTMVTHLGGSLLLYGARCRKRALNVQNWIDRLVINLL